MLYPMFPFFVLCILVPFLLSFFSDCSWSYCQLLFFVPKNQCQLSVLWNSLPTLSGRFSEIVVFLRCHARYKELKSSLYNLSSNKIFLKTNTKGPWCLILLTAVYSFSGSLDLSNINTEISITVMVFFFIGFVNVNFTVLFNPTLRPLMP